MDPAIEAQPPVVTIAQLSDALLGRIFTLACEETGRSRTGLRISIVSHRWQNILYSTPALWRSAWVEWAARPGAPIADLQLKLAAVRRVSPFVESLEWRVYAGEGRSYESAAARDSLVPLLADLQPSQLTELQLNELQSWPAGATRALQRLSRLDQLEMGGSCTLAVHMHVLDAVTSNLRSLELNSWQGVDEPLMARLLHLPHLTRLSLGASGHTWGPLSPLTRLTKLRALKLYSAHPDGPSTLQPPEPVSFHGGLEHFDYNAKCHRDGFQMAGGLLLRCRLETADARCASSRHSPDSLLSLHLLGMSGMPSLPRLLSALLPESMHLQRLEFISCSVDAAALIGCTQLSQLQELSIGEGGIFALGARFGDVSACMASGTLEEALDALLQQTPLLRCLELRDASQPAAGFQQGTVPHCIAACRSLELLVLQRQGLSQLPPGDYLTGLRELSLSYNHFTSLPPALSTATALESLNLSGNPGLQLSQADFSLLRSLPRLEGVRVDDAILQQCRDSLPHVKCSVAFPQY